MTMTLHVLTQESVLLYHKWVYLTYFKQKIIWDGKREQEESRMTGFWRQKPYDLGTFKNEG